jgi:WD40 repeat protein
MALVLLNLALASCGSEVTTQPQISAAPAIVPTSAPPATSPTTTATPTTPAVTTPSISSGLTKGKLKEVFPILARLPEATIVRLNPVLGNMFGDKSTDYELRRTVSDFSGLGLFQYYSYISNFYSYTYEEAREITIPMAEMRRYLELLAETPIEEGPYKGPPLVTVTDYYPKLRMEIETGNGPLLISSVSQKPDFFPWTINFAGRTFTASDAIPFQAYSILEPYLKQGTLEDMRAQAEAGQKNNTQPSAPTPIQELNPLKYSQIWFLPNDSNLDGLVVSPDSNFLVGSFFSGAPGSKIVYWAPDGKLVKSWDSTQLWFHKLIFSRDGQTLFGSVNDEPYSLDGDINRWETATGKELAPLVGHRRGVNALALSTDGKLLASASNDRTVRLWSLPDGKNVATLQAKLPEIYSLFAVAFSPDNKRIVAAGRGDPTTKNFPIKMWSVSSGQEEMTLRGHAAPVQTLAFTPDGKTMVSADEAGTIILWDTTTWQKRQTIDSKVRSISVSLSPDGKWLMGAYIDGGMRLWEVATGKLLSVTQVTQVVQGRDSTTFDATISPDGRYIVTYAARTVQKWDR